VLARAAVGGGVSGIVMDTPPRPEEAVGDGPKAWPLHRVRELMESLLELDRTVKARPLAEESCPA